jgi:hypothetical protein
MKAGLRQSLLLAGLIVSAPVHAATVGPYYRFDVTLENGSGYFEYDVFGPTFGSVRVDITTNFAHYTPFAHLPTGSGEASGQLFKFYSDPYAPFATVPDYSELELHFATMTHLDQTSWLINVIENGLAGSKVSQGFVLRTTIDPVPLPPTIALFLGLLAPLCMLVALLRRRFSNASSLALGAGVPAHRD